MEAALLKIPLIAPGVLQGSMRITMEITAVHDVNIGKAFGSDVRYGISDVVDLWAFKFVIRKIISTALLVMGWRVSQGYLPCHPDR